MCEISELIVKFIIENDNNKENRNEELYQSVLRYPAMYNFVTAITTKKTNTEAIEYLLVHTKDILKMYYELYENLYGESISVKQFRK